jgi:hypothetical protein
LPCWERILVVVLREYERLMCVKLSLGVVCSTLGLIILTSYSLLLD